MRNKQPKTFLSVLCPGGEKQNKTPPRPLGTTSTNKCSVYLCCMSATWSSEMHPSPLTNVLCNSYELVLGLVSSSCFVCSHYVPFKICWDRTNYIPCICGDYWIVRGNTTHVCRVILAPLMDRLHKHVFPLLAISSVCSTHHSLFQRYWWRNILISNLAWENIYERERGLCRHWNTRLKRK